MSTRNVWMTSEIRQSDKRVHIISGRWNLVLATATVVNQNELCATPFRCFAFCMGLAVVQHSMANLLLYTHTVDSGALTQQVVGDLLDLSTCEDVRYNAWEGILGVCYRRGGKEDWTPVKKFRGNQEKSASMNADTTKFPYGSKDIRYMVKDGAPGIYYRCGNTSQSCTWIQIEPSPIALWTRARTKLDGSS